jgi:hypothetical protein
MTEATTGLISHLTEHLGNDEAWRPALDALKRGDATLHLAVLGKPFLGPLLDGIKTIESRFSRVRHAPYGVLRPGDIVAVKQPGGPVVGAFQAGEVRNYRLTPGLINKIRGRFGQQIHAHDQFWDDRADSRYATLAVVAHPRTLPRFPFPKRDRRGWAVLTGRKRAGSPEASNDSSRASG